ncbi:MAG: DUF948 domain-containing protein [Leptolyngbyaceae cyanobacterium CRU_2_3]|nr:DUF948 domain-containing protein [Leptolyngbyaceae cyanobacterium CRU_2_3]
MDPLFWLGLSILLVAVSLTAVLMAAVPAFRELARAARSAEKLFDTLSRELPPTLEAIRLTGMEITDLKEDVSEGVQSVGRVVQQVDQSIGGVKKQAQQAQHTTRSLFVGVRAAWKSFHRTTYRTETSSRRLSSASDFRSMLPGKPANRLDADNRLGIDLEVGQEDRFDEDDVLLDESALSRSEANAPSDLERSQPR